MAENYNELIERSRRAVKRLNKIAQVARLNKAPKAKAKQKRAPSAATVIKRAQQTKAPPAPVRRRVSAARAILKAPSVSVSPIAGVASRPSGGVVPGTAIPWNPVISSNVAAIAFEPESDTLFIMFLDSSVYRYTDVEADTFKRFQAAPSKGKFVWQEIRDRYAYMRIR